MALFFGGYAASAHAQMPDSADETDEASLYADADANESMHDLDTSCHDGAACHEAGQCGGPPDRCVAASDQDCKESRLCVEQGQCSLYRGRCVARTEEACTASAACQLEGRCRALSGRCISESEARRMVNEQPMIPYRDGESVPDGYQLRSEPKYELIAVGATVLGGLWLASTVSAIVLDSQPDGTGDPNFDDDYATMFIPVAGPFVTIATADSSGTGTAILALDGALQLGGAALMVAGFISSNNYLAPMFGGVQIAPMIGETNGVSLRVDL